MTVSKQAGKYRAGYVALVGQPNAGKSTLLNTLLGEKVAIVSEKPQTTRRRVTGILSLETAQVIFVDSPGRLKSTSGINKFLQDELSDVMDKADVIVALLSAEDPKEPVEELIELLKKIRKPWTVVVTKSDLMGGTRTPKFFQYFIDEKVPFTSVSSFKRPEEARTEVLEHVIPLLPLASAPLFDAELYTTHTVRQLAAEFIREACFVNLQQEIPYGLAVKITEFDETGEIVRISADLVVERDSHRGIVLGSGGQTIKKIGTIARKEIEKIVGAQIFLQLHVSVKENWTKNPGILKELGYVVQKR